MRSRFIFVSVFVGVNVAFSAKLINYYGCDYGFNTVSSQASLQRVSARMRLELRARGQWLWGARCLRLVSDCF